LAECGGDDAIVETRGRATALRFTHGEGGGADRRNGESARVSARRQQDAVAGSRIDCGREGRIEPHDGRTAGEQRRPGIFHRWKRGFGAERCHGRSTGRAGEADKPAGRKDVSGSINGKEASSAAAREEQRSAVWRRRPFERYVRAARIDGRGKRAVGMLDLKPIGIRGVGDDGGAGV
jgi:hypothetical protein